MLSPELRVVIPSRGRADTIVSTPFGVTGYLRNVIGFRAGHGLRWDPYCSGRGDVDLGLQAMLKHRIIWRDKRWVFLDEPLGSNAGGQVGRRTTAALAQADERLLG